MLILLHLSPTQDSKKQEVISLLDKLCATIAPSDLPLGELQHCFIYDRLPKNFSPLTTCGKILLHAKRQVVSFREHLGVSVAVFKIGVTASPAYRFKTYLLQNFQSMWVIFRSNDLSIVHMLEAALISEFGEIRGCRNTPNTGGEGALNRTVKPEPPFFVYITGGRADQPKRVG